MLMPINRIPKVNPDDRKEHTIAVRVTTRQYRILKGIQKLRKARFMSEVIEHALEVLFAGYNIKEVPRKTPPTPGEPDAEGNSPPQ